MIRMGSELRRAALLLCGVATAALAQRARGGEQRVTLAVRPYPGDAIRQRIEHAVDEQGTMTLSSGDSTIRVSTRTTLVVKSHVDAADSVGVLVTTQVESVTVRATGGKDESRRARIAAGMALQGRSLKMKLAPDGGLVVLDDGSGQSVTALATLAALVDRVPAALPVLAVRERESWTRHMTLAGAPGDGIDAQFTLDSLTRYGDLAWISVRGLMRDAGADAGASVAGWILIDRRRGWITRSRMLMTMRSTTGAQGTMPPMRFVMRVEQTVGEVNELRARR
jgi:hypothetical protein